MALSGRNESGGSQGWKQADERKEKEKKRTRKKGRQHDEWAKEVELNGCWMSGVVLV